MPPSCGRRNSGVRLAVLVAALCLWNGGASAEISLNGRLQQGGLVLGRAAPGSLVSLDGRSVPVESSGVFLLGFGRDAPPEARLTVVEDGRAETRVLAIAPRQWAVQRVEGLPKEKVEPDPATVARIKADGEMMKALRARVTPSAAFLGGFVRPAEGVVSGVFGSQRVYNGLPGAPHSGLDIAGPKGQPVAAVADGVVVLAEPDMVLTGRTVAIDHGLGLMSSYAHLSSQAVAVGQRVTRGQVIGGMGATGLATGVHLHWGLSWLEVRLDPEVALSVLGP